MRHLVGRLLHHAKVVGGSLPPFALDSLRKLRELLTHAIRHLVVALSLELLVQAEQLLLIAGMIGLLR